MYKVKVKGKTYSVIPSKKEFKKYDVYLNDKFITSFGDKRYEHFKDLLGHYKHKDHGDPERRRLYRIRHKNDNIDDPNYAGFWSWNYLW